MRGAVTTVAAVEAAIALFFGGAGTRIDPVADTASIGTHGAPSALTVLPSALPAGRSQLIADLDRAQQMIDTPASSRLKLESAGRFEQLASAALANRPPRRQRAILSRMSAAAAAMIRTSLAAASALRRLGTTHRSLPPWRIVAPPRPATLLGYFGAYPQTPPVPLRRLLGVWSATAA